MVESIKKKNSHIKLVVVGLDNAGKSTLLSAYLNRPTVHPPTFGYKIYSARLESGLTITVVDVGGQECFKKYWANYFEGVDGVVCVLDCLDPRPADEYIKGALEAGVPVSVIFNKIDLVDENKKEEWGVGVEDERVRIFKASALTGEGVQEGFEWVVRSASGRRGGCVMG